MVYERLFQHLLCKGVFSVSEMTVFLRRYVPDITNRYTKGESCELAVERGYHLTYRLGCPSGSRDDIVQRTSTRSVVTRVGV